MSDITYEDVKPFKPIEFKLEPEPTPIQQALSDPTTLLLGGILIAIIVIGVFILVKAKRPDG